MAAAPREIKTTDQGHTEGDPDRERVSVMSPAGGAASVSGGTRSAASAASSRSAKSVFSKDPDDDKESRRKELAGLTRVDHTVPNHAVATMMPSEAIEVLELDGNYLEPFPNLVYALSGKPNLRELRIRAGTQTQLPYSIGKLTRLESLQLGDNPDLTGAHKDAWKCTTLRSLIAWGNPALEELGDGISNCTRLTMLSLHDNRLRALPRDIGHLKLLEELLASNNNISKLPRTIGCLQNLQGLDLSGNQLRSLPDQVCVLKKLERLLVSGNSLSTLPGALGNMFRLRVLDASNNELTELPRSIGQLCQLHSMNLSQNMLRILPEELGGCAQLAELNLENNSLLELPFCTVMMTRLETLRLKGNSLHHHRTDPYGREFTYEAVLDQLREKERKQFLSDDFDSLLGVEGTGKLLPIPRDIFTLSDALATGVPEVIATGKAPGIGARAMNEPDPLFRALASGETKVLSTLGYEFNHLFPEAVPVETPRSDVVSDESDEGDMVAAYREAEAAARGVPTSFTVSEDAGAPPAAATDPAGSSDASAAGGAGGSHPVVPPLTGLQAKRDGWADAVK